MNKCIIKMNNKVEDINIKNQHTTFNNTIYEKLWSKYQKWWKVIQKYLIY